MLRKHALHSALSHGLQVMVSLLLTCHDLALRVCHMQDVKQWRNIAFCLSQLSIGDKGFHKLADMFPAYKDSLGDSRIHAHFQVNSASRLQPECWLNFLCIE